MRKTLFAMLGLVAIGLWAIPVVAAPAPGGGFATDGPKVRLDTNLENRAGAIGAMARGESYKGTLSGTLLKSSAVVTTTYFLYPGACVQRSLGTWAAKTGQAVADSLQPHPSLFGTDDNGYQVGQPDPASNLIAYTRADLSLPEKLWHIESSATPAGERPPIIDNTRMLWCGKHDPIYLDPDRIGYPNLTFQILYLDTGTHANAGGKYHLNFEGQFSAEINYDYVAFIGGGDGGLDPLTNRRDYIGNMMPPAGLPQGGPTGHSDQIVTFTGAIMDPQSTLMNTSTTELQVIVGDPAADPLTVSYSIEIDDDHRAVYVVFTADCLFSSEDNLWPNSDGQMIDLLEVKNDAVTPITLYDDAAPFVPPAGVRLTDAVGGTVLVWSGASTPDPGDDIPIPIISSRVPSGVGERWQLTNGTFNPTSDVCAPFTKGPGQTSDLFFEGGDKDTNQAIKSQYNAIIPCTFPIPAGTAQVFIQWDEYMNMPRFSGYVQDAEYRIYKGGNWGQWEDTDGTDTVTGFSAEAWITDSNDISQTSQADSLQLRFEIRCIPPFAADRRECVVGVINPLLYDNFKLQVVTGTGAPFFASFPGSVAQTTFVDGVIGSTTSGPPSNCGANVNQCWPGNRGSGLGTPQQHNIAVHDNWNAATGDSITLSLWSGLRKNGMGINWKHGFSKDIEAGEIGPPGSEYAYTNASFNNACDTPRMIYRLFDPAARAWSPWDSTELVANSVTIGVADTVLIDSEFNINWPPYDKVIANASLPGPHASAPGWLGTVGGVSNYSGLNFLPRGTRMQYYFKATDITCAPPSYQFSTDVLARETEDLPFLPNSNVRAPDIIEWRVLPSVYAPGPAGSLLAGRTNTPVLNLDYPYGGWSFGYDPMTQALRALGVRADRWRRLGSGTTANGFGGHELPFKRPDRLSNFFPNYLEYPLIQLLADSYRIIIQSGHALTRSTFDEQDAEALRQWWISETPTDGGDRCTFLSGDDQFFYMIVPTGVDATLQQTMANQVFGVADVANTYSSPVPYFNVTDTFAGGTAYPIDGGCPTPNKFDALTKVNDPDAAIVATYPGGQAAAVSRMREMDVTGDKDRNKSLAYGYSIQFIRNADITTGSPNYTRSGIENRIRVMYKFLTSCRGDRAGQVSSSVCWPCPIPLPQTNVSMTAEWANQSTDFQTTTFGPLYPIQAGALATGVFSEVPDAAPKVNKVFGHAPNPFNPHTAIHFASSQAGKAEVRIFNVSGALVRTLRSNVTVGPNEIRWNGKKDDGSSLASGVYFYKIVFPNGETLRAPNNLVLVK